MKSHIPGSEETKNQEKATTRPKANLILDLYTFSLLGLGLSLPLLGPGRSSLLSSQGRHLSTQHQPTLVNLTIEVKVTSGRRPAIKHMRLTHDSFKTLLQQLLGLLIILIKLGLGLIFGGLKGGQLSG